ncbi:MAG: FAD binding domain-containing protein [Ilumatobacteraceae bacterium]
MSFQMASTLDDALAALADGARPIAGGTDLVVGARHGKAPLPDRLVAVDRVAELRGVCATDSGVAIGALTSHHEIEQHPLLGATWSALADGSALVGSPATRHVGTLGGNVMNSSPAMDTGAPLVVLGAEVELRSTRGSRRVTVGDLWTGPGRHSAADDELCTVIHLPTPAPRSGSAYVRLEYRRAMEIAVVGAAANVTLAADGSVECVCVALTAVAPVILPVTGLDHVAGMTPADAAAAVRAAASTQARPISDVRASDDYRRHAVGVMAGRAVEAAARRAAGEHLAIPVNRSVGIGAAAPGAAS